MQAESLDSWHEFSLPSTPVVIHRNLYSSQNEFYDWVFGYAMSERLDWVMTGHDDVQLLQGGWEASLQEASKYRVAIASHFPYDSISDQCVPVGIPGAPEEFYRDGAVVRYENETRRFAASFDPATMALRMDVFAARGRFSNVDIDGWGYQTRDIDGYALSKGYGVWRIRNDARHKWLPDEGTRGKLGRGALGIERVASAWGGKAYPAKIFDDDLHLEIAGRMVCLSGECEHGDEAGSGGNGGDRPVGL
jgi:hypothetical protein